MEAYRALASYDMAVLEAIEALRPLHDYVKLLLSESVPAARMLAEKLAEQAVAFEHANRRRYVSKTAPASMLPRTQHADAGPCRCMINTQYIFGSYFTFHLGSGVSRPGQIRTAAHRHTLITFFQCSLEAPQLCVRALIQRRLRAYTKG